jgi:hypothetical protein
MHLHQELSDFVHASFQRWERTSETGIKEVYGIPELRIPRNFFLGKSGHGLLARGLFFLRSGKNFYHDTRAQE